MYAVIRIGKVKARIKAAKSLTICYSHFTINLMKLINFFLVKKLTI